MLSWAMWRTPLESFQVSLWSWVFFYIKLSKLRLNYLPYRSYRWESRESGKAARLGISTRRNSFSDKGIVCSLHHQWCVNDWDQSLCWGHLWKKLVALLLCIIFVLEFCNKFPHLPSYKLARFLHGLMIKVCSTNSGPLLEIHSLPYKSSFS